MAPKIRQLNKKLEWNEIFDTSWSTRMLQSRPILAWDLGLTCNHYIWWTLKLTIFRLFAGAGTLMGYSSGLTVSIFFMGGFSWKLDCYCWAWLWRLLKARFLGFDRRVKFRRSVKCRAYNLYLAFTDLKPLHFAVQTFLFHASFPEIHFLSEPPIFSH